MKRPIEIYLLSLLLLVLSLNGLVAGALMLVRPDGSLLKMDPTWLDSSPFNSYLIPGFLLSLLIGLLPLLSLTGLIFRPAWNWPRVINIYPDKHWSWTLSLYSGIGTIIWIIVQEFLTQFFILQPVILCFGLSVVILTLMPRTIKFYTLHHG